MDFFRENDFTKISRKTAAIFYCDDDDVNIVSSFEVFEFFYSF